jgi:hypothetical protein
VRISPLEEVVNLVIFPLDGFIELFKELFKFIRRAVVSRLKAVV